MNLTTTEKYLHELDVDREVGILLDADPEAVISTKSNHKSNRKP